MKKLFRGVSKILDCKNDGLIKPSGEVKNVVALHDGTIKYNGTFTYGNSLPNTARAHQLKSGLYGAAGISTSRSEQIAIRFATSRYRQEGYIYVINEDLLQEAGIEALEFENSAYPNQKEVTLILPDSEEHLPSSLILEKYAVKSNGERG